MSQECVIAVFEDLDHAHQAVHILDRGEFPIEQVSIVTKGLKEQPEIEDDLEMEDNSARDMAIGAGLGAIVGLLPEIAVTSVSGLGLVFLLGPMSGLTGAAVGGLLGGMVGWGVHGQHVRHYEKLVRQGKVLVVAHGDPLELARADRVLKETDPLELHIYGKTDLEAPEFQT